MEITQEIAQKDIEKSLQQYETQGAGTNRDRAAQAVIQTIEVFRNRLEKPTLLKVIYIDNPGASILPEVITEMAKEIHSGKLKVEEAKERIDKEIIPGYLSAFKELGVNPEAITLLYIDKKNKEK